LANLASADLLYSKNTIYTSRVEQMALETLLARRKGRFASLEIWLSRVAQFVTLAINKAPSNQMPFETGKIVYFKRHRRFLAIS
jgi:hypothetical protein